MEFDIDAALARKPDLLLVDEFAHSNAPGSRHPKRWQDVEELIGAGVNVWTTLNIQHLESLVDVVWKITGVRQRETVPDGVLAKADEIEIVDITPAELRQRLAEGKVYVPETARLASENFFKPENLTALRELALRRAAQVGRRRADGRDAARRRRRALGGGRAHPGAGGRRRHGRPSGALRPAPRRNDGRHLDRRPRRAPRPRAGLGAGALADQRRHEAGRAARRGHHRR